MCDDLMYSSLLFINSSEVKREFDLKTHRTKQEVLKAIDNATHETGGSNTHLVIDELIINGFSEANGARSGHPRVGVLLADSSSNLPNETISSASKTRDADVTMMVVGVGDSLSLSELKAIASDRCRHLNVIQNFTEMDSLVHVIRRRICEGMFILRCFTYNKSHSSVFVFLTLTKHKNLRKTYQRFKKIAIYIKSRYIFRMASWLVGNTHAL